MAQREVKVLVLGDASDFSREIRKATTEADTFATKLAHAGESMASMGRKMSIGFTLPIVAGFGLAIKAASDLNESMNKSATVFGSSSAEINKWATGAARDFGMSTRAAHDAAGSFGNMFVQLGVGAGEAAKMSMSMTELAADFASFHNADITEVIQAQSAAFRGEYDALQRFVPMINAAAVEQKAMAMTGKETAAVLTAQEKALAVYALMLEGAGDAMGDFDRTSDGMANRMRIAKAELENAAASIGSVLIPAAAGAAGMFANIASAVGGLPAPIVQAAVGIAAFGAALGPVLWISGNLIKVLGAVGSAFGVDLVGMIARSAASMGAWGLVVGLAIGVVVGIKQAIEGWTWSITANAEAVHRMTDAQLKNQVAAAQGKLSNDLFIQTVKELAKESTDAARRVVEAADLSKGAREKLLAVIEKEEAAQARAAGATQKEAAALQSAAGAANNAAAGSRDLQSALDELVGAQLGVEGAAINMERAIASANEHIAAGTGHTLEGRSAFLQAKDASIDYGQAVFNAAIQAGASMSEARDQQIAALQAVAASMAPGSDIRRFIDEYIWKLGEIPDDIDTTVRINDQASAILERIKGLSNSLLSQGAWVLNVPPPQGYSKGGWVEGYGNRDSVPAMLTPGEFVVSKDMMAGRASVPAAVSGSDPASIQIIIVRDMDEALRRIPEAARAQAQSAFLSARA